MLCSDFIFWTSVKYIKYIKHKMPAAVKNLTSDTIMYWVVVYANQNVEPDNASTDQQASGFYFYFCLLCWNTVCLTVGRTVLLWSEQLNPSVWSEPHNCQLIPSIFHTQLSHSARDGGVPGHSSHPGQHPRQHLSQHPSQANTPAKPTPQPSQHPSQANTPNNTPATI